MVVYREGAMTVVLGAIFFFCLPRNIDTCKYLRHEEKELLHKAMASEGLTKASDVSTVHCRRHSILLNPYSFSGGKSRRMYSRGMQFSAL